MKTRNGFVSNSSSSSFVLITSKKTMADVAKTLSMPEKKFLKSIIGSGKSIKLDGKEKIIYSDTYYTEMIYENYETNIVQEPEYEDVEGCEHEYNRTRAKFCQECGKPAYIESEVNEYDGDSEEDGMELFENIMKKFNNFKDSFASVEPF